LVSRVKLVFILLNYSNYSNYSNTVILVMQTMVKLIILTSILVFSVCIALQYNSRIWKLGRVDNMNSVDGFESTPTTTFDISTAPTPANKNTTCSNSTDIVNVCMNYENCCAGAGTNTNSKCFCSHPFVGGCNDAYKSCLASVGAGGDTSKCDATLKGCCGKYSSINIMSSNFNKPINAYQSSNQICTVNGLRDLEQRCMELCQTNPSCKAYSLVLGGCTLYDSVNNNPGTSNDKYIYVVKK